MALEISNGGEVETTGSPTDIWAEWLEPDGLGGFASGTVGGIRTRRYHALLLAALAPPTGRHVLVNGFEAWIERGRERIALTSQLYLPDVRHPDGVDRLAGFAANPWPRWIFRLPDGTEVEQQLFVRPGAPRVFLSWRLRRRIAGVRLLVRPLLSGRDYHGLHRENPHLRADADVSGYRVGWRTYDGLPAVVARSNGTYRHEPVWYRNFLYPEERARGLDHAEDLFSPGTFAFSLSRGEAVWVLEAAEGAPSAATQGAADVDGEVGVSPSLEIRRNRDAERRRREAFPSALHRAGDAYLVRRDGGLTVVAGYPWFPDWGRDTFIALRGLCIATRRLSEAERVLLAWADAVSEGMLPNRFPDRGEDPEFNSVDASLWYVIAVHEYLSAVRGTSATSSGATRRRLTDAGEAILTGYADGTRYGIRADHDGLLAAGEPGQQLTWMDARVGDRVVTPRIGKPVEVQALWLNALRIGAELPAGDATRWRRLLEAGSTSFPRCFWNPEGRYLYDVVDVDHVPGTVDATFRPNQIFAVGGLPYPSLDLARGREVVDAVEARLLTPMGLRSLAPTEAGYAPRYRGGVRERDRAYHQGTVWPWLLGPFVEAWIRVRGGDAKVRSEARSRFLVPLLRHLGEAGLGHISEIADAEPPHIPRGCPFQAWSVGEALRLEQTVLAPVGASLNATFTRSELAETRIAAEADPSREASASAWRRT